MNASIYVPFDYETIAEALAAANPGDVVGICPGIYEEPITLRSGVHVQGSGLRRTQIVPPDNGPPGNALVHASNIDDATVVAGFVLDGKNTSTLGVVVDSESSGLQLSSNEITGCLVGVTNGLGCTTVIGGSLPTANDIWGNAVFDVYDAGGHGDSLNATLNYWGTHNFNDILAKVSGPVRVCPITDATHSESLCGPVGIAIPSGREGAPALLRITPNPTRGLANVSYVVPEDGKVRVWICDVRGREVSTLVDQVAAKGMYSARWSGIGAGTYFVNIEVAGIRDTSRLVVLR